MKRLGLVISQQVSILDQDDRQIGSDNLVFYNSQDEHVKAILLVIASDEFINSLGED